MRLEDGSRCGLRTIEFCDQDDTQTDEVGGGKDVGGYTSTTLYEYYTLRSILGCRTECSVNTAELKDYD